MWWPAVRVMDEEVKLLLHTIAQVANVLTRNIFVPIPVKGLKLFATIANDSEVVAHNCMRNKEEFDGISVSHQFNWK